MKKVAEAENKLIVTIPEIVSVTIVAIEPQITVVPFHIENVGVAIGVRLYRIPPCTPLLEYSQSCI